MCNTIANVWLFVLVLLGNLEHEHHARTVLAAEKIEIGDDAPAVLTLLGKPLARYEKYNGWGLFRFGARPKQWCYGTRLNLSKLFVSDIYFAGTPLPINFRLLAYADEDLIIDWDTNDRVADLTILEIPIDHRWDKLFSTIYAWHQIRLAIAAVPVGFANTSLEAASVMSDVEPSRLRGCVREVLTRIFYFWLLMLRRESFNSHVL